jgi:bifunctional ADP-heptose synthase (sugar kinase/adenylyltransferase)
MGNNKNIFVIGDLVVDHSVFVKDDPDTIRIHQSIEGEKIFEVFKRQDDAGGAANTAKILSTINKGRTFLWGILGKSNWGDFRSILNNSNDHEVTSFPIELFGSKDETDSQMNTITRIIKIKPEHKKLTHIIRYDDFGNTHITDGNRKSVLEYLNLVKINYGGLDSIIINDLDYGCLTKELVNEISNFAYNNNVPLFIDPKIDISKYHDVHATAILPNLTEWCNLVQEKDNQVIWRNKLNKLDGLAEMAQLSFTYIKNIKYHIIKCDKDGTIIIAPHIYENNKYSVYKIDSLPTKTDTPPDQIGCGDILLGAFAYECSGMELDTKSILFAFSRANVIVKCYRDMPWHRTPNYDTIENEYKIIDKINLPEPKTEVSTGRLFLPKKNTHILSIEYSTVFPDIFSQDINFREKIQEFLNDIIDNSSFNYTKSIILNAPSGTGKTTIIDYLKSSDFKQKYFIETIDYTNTFYKNLIGVKNFDQFFEYISKKAKEKVIIIVDEVLKAEKDKILLDFGVVLLNAAHKNNVRFLFVDADFEFKFNSFDRQFTSRCHMYKLPGIENRLNDIHIIAVAYLFALSKRKGYNFTKISIENEIMLKIINETLKNPNPRCLCDIAELIFNREIKKIKANEKLLDLKLDQNKNQNKLTSTHTKTYEYFP